MKLHLFTGGKIVAWKNLIVRDAPADIRISVPIPFYLLESEKGLFLFDTGQELPAIAPPDDANYIPQLSADQLAVNLLRQKGIAPEDISGIILSHHHEDHSGGLKNFPGTLCIVRREELQYGNWFKDYDSRRWLHPAGEYDLFNDGRVILLPTPGHTAGHQSLLITLDNGEKLLLAADAAYTRKALTDIPPPDEQDQPYWQSLRKLNEYAANGVQIITGHDPEQWNELQAKETCSTEAVSADLTRD